AMVDDHGARTWFATDDGVYAWDGEQLIHKSQHDGLAGRETNRGALLCDTEGRIWVGFARGLSVIDPEREFAATHAPTVAFLTPLVNGQPAPGESHGSHTVQTATFRFRAISMRDQARLRIQHRLEGLTEQWSQPRALPERAVRFASLPPGRYRLHVRATDSRGQIGEAVSPWLLVPAPWWRSPWFHTLVATATILVLVGAMRLFSQRRYARHLERDVLDRTRALTAERSRLQTTLANIADGIALLDPRGVIVLWTPAAARLTGWSDERVRGRRLTDIVPAFVNDGNDHTRDVEVGVHDSRRRWFEYNTAMLANGAGSVVAFRDVTEKRLQDRLLSRSDRLESLGVLAGGLAHDFNNLLTVMLGNLDLIESERGAGNAGAPNEPFANIRDAIVQARGLTQQLLTFSKGGAPVRELQALAPVVSDSARLALSGSNVDCHVLADDDLRDVEIDRGQIAQVVHNLVLNGMQAMPDGGSITIELHNRDHLPTGVDGSFVAIEVRDRGIGIAAAELDRIFDPYYSTKPGGSGLGLATAHSIVTRHGGSLFVESTPGTGTTFSVYLPAAATRAPAHSDDVADDNGHDLAPCRILCMDDNEGVRTVLRRALAGMGHTVTLTASGEHAIEAFHAARAAGRPFDLVLLDLTVPGGMGGIATLEALRTTDPETTAIATTGYSTEPVLAEFERHGFHATLRKPFTVADVQHALCRAMSARRHDPS
ncbi:MAG TPA: response regulator, partial [bacterium]|nr:response regulator [bacterium]